MVMLFDFEFRSSALTHPLRSPVPWPMEIWKAAWDRGLLHSSRLGDAKCYLCFQLKRFEICCYDNSYAVFFLEEIGQIGISRVPQHQKRYEAVA